MQVNNRIESFVLCAVPERIANPKDRFGVEGRIAAAHSRFHVNMSRQKVGCKLCYPPDGKPAEPIVVEPTAQEVKQRSYDDQLWCDRVLELAAVGCAVDVAARIMGHDIQLFMGLVETHFHKSWVTIQQESRLATLVGLQVAAIKDVARGKDKLLLVLDKHGLLPQLGELKAQARGELESMGTLPKDLADRVHEMLETLKERKPYTPSATLSLEDPKPGEGIMVGTRKSHEQDEYDLPVSSDPRAEKESGVPGVKTFADQISEAVQPTEPEQKPGPVIAHTSTYMGDGPAGPVIAHPKPGIHVLEDHIMATERVGVLKKEMIESLR